MMFTKSSIENYALIILFNLMAVVAVAQQKTPYSDYIKENYPESHQAISEYMKAKNPDANDAKLIFLVEFQCKALETLLQAMNEEGSDFNILYRSLEKITESTQQERKTMDFWTWPKTDWVEVENDYFFELDTQ